MPIPLATIADQRRMLAASHLLVLQLLDAMPPRLLATSDGPGRWTAHEVLAHLVDLEESERGWMARIRHILDGTPSPLPRVQGGRHLPAVAAAPTAELRERFARGRAGNLARIDGLGLDAPALARAGMHPDLGPLRAGHLLAAWSLHDLDHLAQIVRIIGHQQTDDVGPIAAYLRICRSAPPS